MEKVKAWRKKRKLFQSVIADHLGVTQGAYSRYEAMKMVMPPVLANKLIAYAKATGTTLRIDDFYSWTERKKA